MDRRYNLEELEPQFNMYNFERVCKPIYTTPLGEFPHTHKIDWASIPRQGEGHEVSVRIKYNPFLRPMIHTFLAIFLKGHFAWSIDCVFVDLCAFNSRTHEAYDLRIRIDRTEDSKAWTKDLREDKNIWTLDEMFEHLSQMDVSDTFHLTQMIEIVALLHEGYIHRPVDEALQWVETYPYMVVMTQRP